MICRTTKGPSLYYDETCKLRREIGECKNRSVTLGRLIDLGGLVWEAASGSADDVDEMAEKLNRAYANKLPAIFYELSS